MATFVEITGDPDEVRANAARLTAKGQALTAKSSDLLEGITSIEGGRPWGGDKFGDAFLQDYGNVGGAVPGDESLRNDAAEHGSARDALLALAAAAGKDASDLGEAVTWALLDYQSADEQAADEIANTQ